MLRNSVQTPWRRLAAAILTAGVLAGQAVDAEDEPELDAVALQLKWHDSFQFAGYYAAKWQGYYRAEGLNVTLLDAPARDYATTAVLNGKAQYGVMASGLLFARLQGQPVVALAAIFQHSGYIILVRADSGIATPSDLAGRTLMTQSMATGMELNAMLLQEGVSPASVNFVLHSQGIDALIDGRVDGVSAYITNEPRLLRSAGIEPRSIRPIDYGVDFYGDCLFTSENEWRQHPERVAAFRRASLRGWEYAMSHVTEMAERIAAMPSVAARGITAEHLRYQAEQMQDLIRPGLVEIGHMNPGRWKRMADTYVELGMVDADYSLDGFLYDPHPVTGKQWIFILLGSLAGVVLVGCAAWIWTGQLRRAVTRSTRQLSESEGALRRSVQTGDRLRTLLMELNRCNRLDTMLPHLLDAAIDVTGMDGGAVYLIENEAAVIRCHRGLPAGLIQAEKQKPVTWPILQNVLAASSATDLCAASGEVRQQLHNYQLRHAYSAPLRRGKEVLGVINVATRRETPPDDAQLHALLVLALEAESAFGRLKAEEEHGRLALAMEQAVEHIIITDVNGKILYVNPAFERVTGYSKEEVYGRNPRLLKSGQHDDVFYGAMWEDLRQGKIWRGHIVNQRKDGTLFTEEASLSPMRDASGEVVSYVAVKRDITHEIEMEEQLRQSQKMEAVGQLAGGMAHDFNNLLQIILGYTSLILSESDAHNPVRADIEQIHEAASRASKLTGQLLTFSRRQVMEQVRLDVNDVVENLKNMLRGLIGAHIEFEIRPTEGLWMTQADRGQLEQILINLCVNARDAMPHGGRLTIETRNVALDARSIPSPSPSSARSGRYVLLAVSDTGCGMDAHTRQRMFDPFFTTKAIGKGTGMGLATVYGIVTQHRGSIQVDSQVGKGSEFQIYLPVDEGGGAQPAQAKPETQTARGTETILVAEDEEAVRRLTVKVLRSAGYTILEAADGAEALHLLEQHGARIDLALLDVVMPVRGGRDVYDAIVKAHPHINVLFVSGYSPGSVHTDFVLNAGLDLIKKPFQPNELLRRVRDRLQPAE